MTLAIVFVLLVIALCCIAWRWRRTGAVLGFASFFLVVVIGCGPVPAWLLARLQAANAQEAPVAWGPRNAIVLLGAGTEKIPPMGAVEPGTFSYARILKAAALYDDCRTTQADCKIFAAGGDPRHNGRSEAEIDKETLSHLGIAPADILTETASNNTWQNAQFTSALLRDYAPVHVLLVSSGFHLPRAVLYFQHFGVDAIPVRADYLKAIPSLLPAAYNFAVSDFAIAEYIGLARYRLYNAMGWNAPKVLPGTS